MRPTPSRPHSSNPIPKKGDPVSGDGLSLQLFLNNNWREYPVEMYHNSTLPPVSRFQGSIEKFRAIRCLFSVGCTDLWIRQKQKDEERVLLICRSSPYAPLQNWWFPIGGRARGSQQGLVPFISSAASVLSRELGAQKEDVNASHILGFAITEFEKSMTYYDIDKNVVMSPILDFPLSTVNINLLIELKEGVDLRPPKKTASQFYWISNTDLKNPNIKAGLSDFVISHLESIFRK